MSPTARRWAVVVVVLAVTALVSGAALAVFAPSVGALYGLDDLGPSVDAGLPVARVAALAAFAVAIGQLLIAAVYVPGPGTVSPEGYRALRSAAPAALVAAIASGAAALLTAAENSAIPPATLIVRPDVLAGAVAVLAPAAGWVLTGLGALLVAAGALVALSWRTSVGMLLLACAALGPMTLTTSTNAERSHDILGDALAVHGLAAVLWLGSTVAVVLHVARRGAASATVLRRHSRLVGVCLAVVTASGLVTAAVQIRLRDVLTSGYGLLVMVSVVLVVAAGVAAHRARGRAANSGPRSALAVLALEGVLLAVASGVGTGLVRVFPPDAQTYTTTRLVYLIGYELPPRLTAVELALFWRWDTLFGTVAALGACWYLWAARRLRRRGVRWPVGRSASWLAGCVVLLLATSSGLGAYAPAVFSVHMVQHMLLATLVPVLLVVGDGLGLALACAAPGARTRIVDLLDSPAARLVTHPLVAWTAVAVTLFGLYATGLYAAVVQEHWAHLTMDAAFLGTGLLLYWPVLGNPLPGRGLPPVGQIVMVFAVMALHAAFAAWLLSRPAPIAWPFFSSLQLPYVPDLLADQRRGALLAWAIGEVPTLVAVAVLVLRWTRGDRADEARPRRPGRRPGRRPSPARSRAGWAVPTEIGPLVEHGDQVRGTLDRWHPAAFVLTQIVGLSYAGIGREHRRDLLVQRV